MKCSLRKIADYISAFLTENKEKTVALRQAWEACAVPMEPEFVAGIKRTSTPGGDSVDGPRLRKILKSFNAKLPAFAVSCSSSEVSVEPEVEIPDEDLIRHHMSSNQECVTGLMNEKELYNLVAEVEGDDK